MRSQTARFVSGYGAHPVHLLGSIAAWSLFGYTMTELGPGALWNDRVWWQSIGVWFLGAVVAHDLILFPAYALADRSLVGALALVRTLRPAQTSSPMAVSPINYVRVPTMAAGLTLLLFFPGIIQQGKSSFLAATGETQQPFFGRWLLLVAGLYGASASAYACRLCWAARRTRRGPSATTIRPPA